MEEMPGYKVLVDDSGAFRYDDARYSPGAFDSIGAAVAACRAIVDRSLRDLHRPGMTAEELRAAYKSWGDDPWVAGPGINEDSFPFSAWTYAEERCRVLCDA